MKKILSIPLAIFLLSSGLYAQNEKSPFGELGYKKKIMYTSSKGEFDEFHDQTNIVEIGSVYFDTKANKIVGLVADGKENSDVAPATTATSIDPHCEKYYWITPYAYCADNPVRLIDPNGKDWVMNNDTKKYEWQDNVTKKGNTPKGYTYVGHENNDILKSLGVKSSYSQDKTRKYFSLGGDKSNVDPKNSRAGAAIATAIPAAEGLTKGEDATGNIRITTNVSYNKGTENNKLGRAFDGVTITGLLTQSKSELTAIGGGLDVVSGNTIYKSGTLVPANVDDNFKMKDDITTSASVGIPAINLYPGSLQNANISAGTTDNSIIYIGPVSIDFDLQDDK
jgi:hypothetical protein